MLLKTIYHQYVTTNEQEMKAFLGINYIISINKLPTIKSNWKCGQFIGNEGIRNVMARSRLEDTFTKSPLFRKHKR